MVDCDSGTKAAPNTPCDTRNATICGNDCAAIVAALAEADRTPGRPHVIILDTLMGKGVPLFARREKNHFIRVEPADWAEARRQLELENA